MASKNTPPKRDRAAYFRDRRARQKEAEAAKAEEERKALSGIQPDGTWKPVFASQRPPFKPEDGGQHIEGMSATHGARSPRRVGEMAAAITAELLGDPGTPDYLRDRTWQYAIAGWAEAEAIVRLLRIYVAEHDLMDAMTEYITEEEDTVMRGPKTKRLTTGRRVHSVIDQLHKAEMRAMTARSKLGLDPLARARLGKDIASQNFDLARYLAEFNAKKELDSAPQRELRGEASSGTPG
jgi:hypothetical protein